MEQALEKLAGLRERARRAGVEGHRQFNPGWHLAIDLRNMLLVSECVARAALERTESRGGHTRDDHPDMDRMWRKVNLVCELDGTGAKASGAKESGAKESRPAGAGPAGAGFVLPGAEDLRIGLRRRPMDPIRSDLLDLFERDELLKYLTDEELDG